MLFRSIPFITGEIEYFNAIKEEKFKIAHAGIEMDQDNNILEETVACRFGGDPLSFSREEVDYVDASSKQCISVATALIPFLEHDDANRALMGSNMQRQAVSCVKPQSPLVGTGLEDKAASDSGQVVLAKEDGEVVEVDAEHIVIKEKGAGGKAKRRVYLLQSFSKSNAFTCMNQIQIGRASCRERV